MHRYRYSKPEVWAAFWSGSPETAPPVPSAVPAPVPPTRRPGTPWPVAPPSSHLQVLEAAPPAHVAPPAPPAEALQNLTLEAAAAAAAATAASPRPPSITPPASPAYSAVSDVSLPRVETPPAQDISSPEAASETDEEEAAEDDDAMEAQDLRLPVVAARSERDILAEAVASICTPSPQLPPEGTGLFVDEAAAHELASSWEPPVEPIRVHIAAGQLTPAVLATLSTMPPEHWWKDVIWFTQRVALGATFVELPANSAVVQAVHWHEQAGAGFYPTPSAPRTVADILAALV